MKEFEKLGGAFLMVWFAYAAVAELPTNWSVRTPPVTNRLNAVTFGAGLFVAVGSEATILTSANGITWTPRSAGMTAPTLWSVAYGNGRYVIGGGEGGLVLASTNGVQWTSVLSTTGTENINGLAYGYNEFVGVGRGGPYGTGYLITSSNGLDWVSRAVPTSNILFAVSAAYSADGVGWADQVYVAVGDHGTILSSTNGVNWILQNSGTTAPLRSVAWHGQMIVAGDYGTVLTSPNGITWTAAAPTSFNNRALVSRFSDPAVVAVGNYATSGRLHASTTGTSWPGSSLEFPSRLNGVTYAGGWNDSLGSFVAVGDGGLIVQAGAVGGQTNDWTKTTSGYWEEAYWSLGKLPAIDQQLIAFRNSGWKALAIGANTTAHYSNALSIQNLLVDSPDGSVNQLLLNWAGFLVPLSVKSNLTIGPGGSLASHYSSLQVGQFDLHGDATFSDAATTEAQQIALRDGAMLNLNDASLTCSDLTFIDGTFTQSNGICLVDSMLLPAEPVWPAGSEGTYVLAGGTLVSGFTRVGWPTLAGQGIGHFTQSGGVHTNTTMNVWGYTRTGSAHWVGFYDLTGGLLVSDEVEISGRFVQSAGTNQIESLGLDQGGNFSLHAGTLTTADVSLMHNGAVDQYFTQTGGVHTVKDRLLLDAGGSFPAYYLTRYRLSGGVLNAANIEVGGAAFDWSGGSISNSGIFNLRLGGALFAGAGTNDSLGKLQVTDAVTYPVNVDVNPPWLTSTGATILRFRDSRDVPWTGSLRIWRWSGTALSSGFGPDHIFIGTNSQSLTADQLSRISFYGPLGWPLGPDGEPTNYPAALLATGELVPAVPPPLNYTNAGDHLVLSWVGEYKLLTATNVSGPYVPVPGATSPCNQTFTDPMRFFRLQSPAP